MISDEIERASNPDNNPDNNHDNNPDNKTASRASDIELFSSTINHAQDTETEEDIAANDGRVITPIITRPNHTAESKENNKASNSHISHVPSFITKETIDNYRLEHELRSLFSGFNSNSKNV